MKKYLNIGAIIFIGVLIVSLVAAAYLIVAEMREIKENLNGRIEKIEKTVEQKLVSRIRPAVLTYEDINDARPELAAYNLVGEHQVVKLAEYIEQRGKIANGYSIARAAVKIGRAEKVDPLLIVAVAEKESTFKLGARSPSGRHHGLMQVDTRIHRKRIKEVGGYKTAEQQIAVGTAVLKEYKEEKGSLAKALRKYSGGSSSYASDVMKRRKIIQRFLATEEIKA